MPCFLLLFIEILHSIFKFEQKYLRALKAFCIQLGEIAFLIGRKAKQCHLFSLCHQQRTQQLTFSSLCACKQRDLWLWLGRARGGSYLI
jgi:hypothetical protein